MNRYLPFWGRILGLLLVCALLLSLAHGAVQARVKTEQLKAQAHLLEKFKKEYLANKDVVSGLEQTVSGMKYVKRFLPLRNTEGNVEGALVHLFLRGYYGQFGMIAGYTKEGKLFGCSVTNSPVPLSGLFSFPSPSMVKMLVDRGKWGYSSKASSVGLEKEDLEIISGATYTFTLLTDALQEGSRFVKMGGKK